MATGGSDADYLVNIQEILMKGTWDPEKASTGSQKIRNRSHYGALKDVYTEPPSGCYVEPDENNFTVVHTIVTGPTDTPYEGGFFYFLVRFPPDYPVRAPRVKIMTTRSNQVRFNPNLYKEGRVCLSLLGTWPGPSWTPAQCLFTILEAIQKILNKEPYHNEPDLQLFGTVDGHSERYNDFLYYETLRSAVCEMFENHANPQLPESLRSNIKELFFKNYDFYMKRIEEKKHLDKQPMLVDTYGREDGTFNFRGLKKRLVAIHSRLSEAAETEEDPSP